jgi:hypothetical protein
MGSISESISKALNPRPTDIGLQKLLRDAEATPRTDGGRPIRNRNRTSLGQYGSPVRPASVTTPKPSSRPKEKRKPKNRNKPKGTPLSEDPISQSTTSASSTPPPDASANPFPQIILSTNDQDYISQLKTRLILNKEPVRTPDEKVLKIKAEFDSTPVAEADVHCTRSLTLGAQKSEGMSGGRPPRARGGRGGVNDQGEELAIWSNFRSDWDQLKHWEKRAEELVQLIFNKESQMKATKDSGKRKQLPCSIYTHTSLIVFL